MLLLVIMKIHIFISIYMLFIRRGIIVLSAANSNTDFNPDKFVPLRYEVLLLYMRIAFRLKLRHKKQGFIFCFFFGILCVYIRRHTTSTYP